MSAIAINKPLFGNLPQELYREIYEFDDTYRNVFKSVEFSDQLLHHIYRYQLELIYTLRNLLLKRTNHLHGKKDNDYYVIIDTHKNFSNILEFNLVSKETENPWICGYICKEIDSQFISNELEEMEIKMSMNENLFSIYYNEMEDYEDEYDEYDEQEEED